MFVWPEISDIPDYRSVISEMGVVESGCGRWALDSAGRLELPCSPALPRLPLVYDVVNREGRLVDRVQLPASLSLAGFGPGVVYLTSREGTGTVIVKYRIH